MSEKKSTTTTTTTKKSGYGFSYILNILAFAAVCIGGIALFIAMILNKCHIDAGNIPNALQTIANSIGWLVLALMSFRFIKNRRKIWLWVVWVIAVVMIFIGIIL